SPIRADDALEDRPERRVGANLRVKAVHDLADHVLGDPDAGAGRNDARRHGNRFGHRLPPPRAPVKMNIIYIFSAAPSDRRGCDQAPQTASEGRPDGASSSRRARDRALQGNRGLWRAPGRGSEEQLAIEGFDEVDAVGAAADEKRQDEEPAAVRADRRVEGDMLADLPFDRAALAVLNDLLRLE